MLFLATSLPLVTPQDDRIVLSFGSGKGDRVEIALTIDQALFAHQALLNVAVKQLDRTRIRQAEGTVIPFSRKRNGGKV